VPEAEPVTDTEPEAEPVTDTEPEAEPVTDTEPEAEPVPSSAPPRQTHSLPRIPSLMHALRLFATTALALALLSNPAARATPTLADGAYATAAALPTPRPDACPVPGPRGTVYVVRAARLTPARVLLYARDNANTAFALDIRNARTPDASGDRGLLDLDGRPQLPSSWGDDSRECTLDFELDAPTATRAAAFAIPRQDRSPLGAHVVARFSTPRRRDARGPPIETVLHVESPPGSPDVRWQLGGDHRDPRDNQFSFTIPRDGQPVPLLDAVDSGDLSILESLPAGVHAEVRTDLAPWAGLSRPGHHVVDCRYETTLVPADVDPSADTTRGQVSDAAYAGQVTFDVR
jgi:hypothetical protein